MFEVIFYRNKNGEEPVLEYIQGIANRADKDSRIKAQKLLSYIDYLRQTGPQAKYPYAKHLCGEIWELRPIRDRILYAAWDGQSFILLHHFKKDTRTTPRREIEKAERNLADYRERGKGDERHIRT